MANTAIWEPPCLCGCQLEITADFTDGSILKGIAYRHPIPFTIKRIAIEKVCEAHKPQTLSMPPTDHLFEIDRYTGKPRQQRGYLQHPITKPTPAECLYQFLSQQGGQIHGYPCGCRTHQFVDHSGGEAVITYLQHPRHHRRCFQHADDTLDMQQAGIDHRALQAESVAE